MNSSDGSNSPFASAAGEDFDPAVEFEQHPWIPIHLGPVDLSITKAVAYLFLGTALTILIGIGLMRWRLGVEPDRRQTVGELVYDVAQTQIAEQGLPAKSIGLLVVLFAALATNPDLAIAGALTYALAYTAELGLSLVVYFGAAR